MLVLSMLRKFKLWWLVGFSPDGFLGPFLNFQWSGLELGDPWGPFQPKTSYEYMIVWFILQVKYFLFFFPTPALILYCSMKAEVILKLLSYSKQEEALFLSTAYYERNKQRVPWVWQPNVRLNRCGLRASRFNCVRLKEIFKLM